MVGTPSPEWGVFRWAWHRAKEYRARFWVGATVFSLIVALIISRLPLPAHPTASQNLIATVLAIIGATAATVIGSYACALAAAPFQQRNALRARLAEAAATIAALGATPVSQVHGDRLRRIAVHLRRSVQGGLPLDYGDEPVISCRAFHEHFPDLRPALGKAREADAALEALQEQLRQEITSEGMDGPPWTPAQFLPWLGDFIRARALQNALGSAYGFEWQEFGPGNVYVGDPAHGGHQILRGGDPADVPACKDTFEKFFKKAELWPEAAAIHGTWDERRRVEKTAVELLTAAANTDPITTRCFLCRGEPTTAPASPPLPGPVP
jgi:hypothetical protein